MLPRPPHPASYVRDDRDTPLLGARDGESSKVDLGQAGNGNIFEKGAGQGNQQTEPFQLNFGIGRDSGRGILPGCRLGQSYNFTERSGIACIRHHSPRIAPKNAQDERCKLQIYQLSTKSKQP